MQMVVRLPSRLAATVALLLVPCVVAGADTMSAGHPVGGDPEYLMRKWETADGLPDGTISAILQTPRGYLWIGTFRGLVRFDGVHFTIYDESNTPELPSEGIVNLHLDQSGRFWVSTLKGMAMLAHDQWRTFGQADGWTGDYARTIVERADGDLLITTFDGHVLEFTDDRFEELPDPPGEPGKGYSGFVDDAGRWCVAQHAFIGHWDGTRWQATIAAENLRSPHVGAAPARGGGQWILLGRELSKYRDGNRLIHHTLEGLSGGIWSMFEDRAGNVWICSYETGLYRVDPGGGLRHWTTEDGLTYAGIRCVFEDRERNLWVGTSGGGLMRFVDRRANGMTGILGLSVSSVSSDSNGNVWIAVYEAGVVRWDGKEEPQLIRHSGIDASLAQCVLADSVGRVWMGTRGYGLWRIEGEQASRIPDDVVGDRTILALFEDSGGRIWFGGEDRAAKLEAGQFSVFGPDQGLRGGGAWCFAEDRAGKIWMANRTGVYRLGESGLGEVTDERGMSIPSVLCLHADSSGDIWMGLARDGLLRWQNGRIARIGTANGLPVESVHGIVEDQDHVFWMATNRGVLRGAVADFRAAAGGPAPIVCQLLTTADGLPSDQCAWGHQPVCTQDASGKLWFATSKGSATIDPARFRINTEPPQSTVEELTYFSPSTVSPLREQHTLKETGIRVEPPFAQGVVLPPGSSRINIHYTAPSLTSPSKVRFQVKLDGLDHDWQAVGNDRVAGYSQLPPGEYVFHVRAANNDGVWNADATQLAFTVTPYYWQTALFRFGGIALLVTASSGAAWWAASSRQRHRRQAEERFRIVVEAAPTAMIVIDLEGRIVLVNAQTESLFGYGRNELIGQSIDMLVPERFRSSHAGYRSNYLAEPSARSMGGDRNIFGRRKDDSEVPVEIGLTPLHTWRGMLVLASVVDLTQRRQREEELARQRTELAHLSRVSLLGELSGSLAHELNQPLTAILSNAQAGKRFMSATNPNLDEVREVLAEIVEDNLRATGVIRRLRSLFRKTDLVFERLDLSSIFADVVKLAHGDAVRRRVDVVFEPDPYLPPIRGDRIQVQQVMLNLLLNAFEALGHSPADDRHVTVQAKADGEDLVSVHVRDNGPGLSGDVLDKIFEPFFTTKSTGMGMGLSISRSIIQAHGGTLEAENNSGGGTTFWFTLPIDKASGG